MRAARCYLALVATLAGCGPSLYDGAHAPLVCADPAQQLQCTGIPGCLASNEEHCGLACAPCAQVQHAAFTCDASAPSLADHRCVLAACQAGGFVPNPDGSGCACPAGTATCGAAGAEACVPEDVHRCGPGCLDCAQLAVPPHAAASCAQGACGFACDAGFTRSAAGDACVCGGGQVACGPGGTCLTESAAACGVGCLACGAPAGAIPLCASHACDYVCPSATPVKCTVGGQPSCCAGPSCSAGQVQCGTPATCVSQPDPLAKQCGSACADCTAQPVPAGATPTCVAAGADFACSFTCPAGTLKSGASCVTVAIDAAHPAEAVLALGGSHTCVRTSQGNVMCWGGNGAGQLGLGDTADRHTPQDVSLGGAAVRAVAAGASHTCAVTEVGGVKCWGSNLTGQLGQPLTTSSSAVPRDVPGVAGALRVAAGAGHTCALLAAGTVTCWGANDRGQVGRGSTSAPVAPSATAVAGVTGATQLTTRGDHTCALAAGGAVFCWGANGSGQTGQAATTNPVTAPAKLPGGFTATSLAAGGAHTCAVVALAQGFDVQCWGDRTFAQLGDGLLGGSTSTPVSAGKLSTIGNGATGATVAAGRAHTCDAKALDITLRCAGANDAAQVGLSPNNPEPNGIDIGIGTVIDALVAGGDHGCALTGGALRCWGRNDSGQLGDGTTTTTGTPVSPARF